MLTYLSIRLVEITGMVWFRPTRQTLPHGGENGGTARCRAAELDAGPGDLFGVIVS